jgi:Transcriptional regulatory protein, C terminal
VVPKEELLDAVWGSRFVGESALTSRVKAARRAIGDDGRTQRLIRTARGRGYQFVGQVEESTPPAEAVPAPPPQQIRFCTTSDDVRLAHATIGDGPPAGEGGELAQPPRLRLAEPGVAALGWSSSPTASGWSDTTNGATDCPTGTCPGSL